MHSTTRTSSASASHDSVPAGLFYYTENARFNFTPVSPFSDAPKNVVQYTGMNGSRVTLDHLRSHDIVFINGCVNCAFTIVQNQRLGMIVVKDCVKCRIYVLDSAVVVSRTCRMINCTKCIFVFEDCDVRKAECFHVRQSGVVYIGDAALVEEAIVIWREGCSQNKLCLAEIKDDIGYELKYRILRQIPTPTVDGQEIQEDFISVLNPLQYPHSLRMNSKEDLVQMEIKKVLKDLFMMTPPVLPHDEYFNMPQSRPCGDAILSDIDFLQRTEVRLTRLEMERIFDDERVEYEEPLESLLFKANEVAQALKTAKHVVFFTGAGISTSANIPDFRGPQGLWTLRDKGLDSGGKDFEGALPTFAHYAITHLGRKRLLKFVVTTNMDGLHTRSGLPRHMIVELHGSGYKECCEFCKKVVHRDYDVCQFYSAYHYTGSKCDYCKAPLQDTIVDFSDTYRTMLDPITAEYHSRKADLAVVLGTSMNVQPAASYPLKVLKSGGKLVIVNLQHTPCDLLATTRVYAKTDAFMERLMQALGFAHFDTTSLHQP
ncbi:silent information regulator family protein [Pelomyxa schiedti]|nr:silent information regulator family protein [Pelomyxa schiedti]